MKSNQSLDLKQNSGQVVQDNKGIAPMIIVIIVGILAISISGGAFWYWGQNQKKIEGYESKTKDLEKQLSEAKKKVEELEEKSSTSEESSGGSGATNTDETANWKTYTNSTYGFSFKYPSDWMVDETNPVISNNVPAPNPNIMIKNSKGEELRIYTQEAGFGLEGVAVFVSYTTKVSSKSLVLSNRQKSASDYLEGVGSTKGYAIITGEIVYGGNTYLINLTGNNKDDWQNSEELFRKIISTFKFTK